MRCIARRNTVGMMTLMTLLLSGVYALMCLVVGTAATPGLTAVSYKVIAIFPRYALSSGPRMTVKGNECEFPFSYRGDTIFDCLEVAGRSQCKAGGVWEECAPKSGNNRRRSLSQAASRVTVAGDACVFPVIYRGEVKNDCFELSGKQQCRTERGTWAECAPSTSTMAPSSGAVLAVSGDECVFPVVYRGETKTECFDISGKLQCRTTKGVWAECASSSTSTMAPAASPSPSPSSGAVLTVSGDECVFPVVYRGETKTECFDVSGKLQCRTAKGVWAECASSSAPAGPRVSVTGDDCVFPVLYRGESKFNCFDLGGKDQCKTTKGIWQECAPPGTMPSTAAPAPAPAAAPPGVQVSVAGDMCVFPVTYRGEIKTQCFELSGKQQCKTDKGTWAECAQSSAAAATRVTVDGDVCIFPISFRGELKTDCFDVSGKSQCKTDKGVWRECAPPGAPAPTSSSSAGGSAQVTVTGEACVFPTSYRGEIKNECFEISGKLQCKTGQGIWQECAAGGAAAAVAAGAQMTVAGNMCAFPIIFRGQVLNECLDISGKSQCKTANGVWEECVASAASGSSSGERVTVSGQSCVFPSVYRGEVMNDCMDVGGKQQCKTAQGVWEECAAPGAAAVPAKPAGPVTVSGASCVFPLIYRGSVFQTCIEVAGDMKCKTDKGVWETCADGTYTMAPTEADSIRFPAGSYYGQVYDTLTNLCDGAVSTYYKPSCEFTATVVEYDPGADDADAIIEAKLMELSASGSYDHAIVAGYEFGDSVSSVAPRFPMMRYTAMDYAFVPPIENVEGVLFRDDQVGYLAGVAACQVAATMTSRVAVIGGEESYPTIKRVNGFRSGCFSVCEDCVVDVVFSSTEDSVAAQLDAKPDVVFGSGTAVGHAALIDAASRGIYVIGVDGDEYESTFGGGAVPGADMILTSALKYVNVAAETSLNDGLQDTFRARNVLLGLSQNALGLAPCNDACGVYTYSMQSTTQNALSGMKNGSIDTGVNRVTGQLTVDLPEAVSSSAAPGASGDTSGMYKVLALLPTSPPFVVGSYYDQIYTKLSELCVPQVGCDLSVEALPRPGGGQPSAAPSAPSSGPVTIKGNKCVFPVVYRGETFTECFDLAGKQQCKTDKGVWEECAAPGSAPVAPVPSPAAAPAGAQLNVYGDACVFPVVYRGETFTECFDLAGKQQCKSDKGVWAECADSSPLTDVAMAIRSHASTGRFDHIIMAGEQFGEPVKDIAIQFPQMRFTVMDYAFLPPIENVEGVVFRDDEVGYLAGVVACEVAVEVTGDMATGRFQRIPVAVVPGVEDEASMAAAIRKRVNGFKQGCKYICADCNVDVMYGTNAASISSRISIKYPRVVFGSGTQVGHEVIKSAAAFGIYVIGVDGDEWVSTFEGGSAPGSNMVLTSALKALDVAAETSLMDGLTNTFRGRNVLLSVGDRALRLAPCHDACTVYNLRLNRQTAEIMMSLGGGAIDTGVNRVTGAMMTVPVRSVPAPASASSSSGGGGDDGDDSSGGGGISAVAIVIIVIIGVIAVGLAVFVFVVLYKERKGRPMFVTLQEEDMEKGSRENELVANRSVSNVSSESSLKI